jgi:hypothetical protein
MQKKTRAPVNDDDPAYQLPQIGLDQKRYVKNANALSVRPKFYHRGKHGPTNGRVNDAVKNLALLGVSKYHVPKLLPVDLKAPILQEDILAKLLNDSGIGRGAGLDHVARYYVCIDNRKLVFRGQQA